MTSSTAAAVPDTTRRSSVSSTQSERDEKIAKLRNIMKESSENLARNNESQKDKVDTTPIPDPFASWDLIGTKTGSTSEAVDANATTDPWSSPVADPFSSSPIQLEQKRNSSSSNSSSDSSSSKPDGSLEKDIFNTIKKQNSVSDPIPTNDLSPFDPVSPVVAFDQAEPMNDPFGDEDAKVKRDPFASSSDSEPEEAKQEAKSSEIHAMLDMWNKKYEVNTAQPTPPPSNTVLTLPPPGTSMSLIDIELNGKAPSSSLDLPPPDLDAAGEEEPEVNDSETAKMEEQWGNSDSSDEEKTQISKKEKIITQTKPINIESTDEDAADGNDSSRMTHTAMSHSR